MPTIKITDELNADIDSVAIFPNTVPAALLKFVKNPSINVILLPDLVSSIKAPLLTARAKPLSFGLKFKDPLDLGDTSGSKLTIAGGLHQTVEVNATPGADLFDSNPFGPSLAVGEGEGWLSLTFEANLGLNLAASAGDVQIGFDAGGALDLIFYRRFQVAAATPTVGEALGEVISAFTLPRQLADLAAMRAGDIAGVQGHGTLKLAADLTLSLAPNPLASPGLPLVHQSVSLEAGASIDLGASFRLTGAFEVRAFKVSETVVELGFYRSRTTGWTISATASAGISATFVGTELLAKLIGKLTGTPELDLVTAINAGQSDGEIARITDTLSSSLDRSLRTSLELELAGSSTGEAAFLYRVELPSLNAASWAAIQAALGGDLSPLTALEPGVSNGGAIAPGVTLVRSCLQRARKKSLTLNINLLGLLNFRSVTELLSKCEIVSEPITGDLTIAETVSGTRLSTLTLPGGDGKGLRKIHFDSLLTTTAYRASGAVHSMAVTSSDVYFAANQNTNGQTYLEYLDALLGLGVLPAGDREGMLAAFVGGTPSTLLLRVEFNDTACRAMFLDSAGKPRAQLEFENVARASLGTLLLGSDDYEYRRRALSDQFWPSMKDKGQANIAQVFPALSGNTLKLEVLATDYSRVVWWSKNMSDTAVRLAAMRSFLGSADPATLEQNAAFNALRGDLQQHMARVVKTSGPLLDLPFGIVALYRSAAPLARPSGVVVAGAQTRLFTATSGGAV